MNDAEFLAAVLNDTSVVAVELMDCGCCGDVRYIITDDNHLLRCVHCTAARGPCMVDGCPIDPSINN